MSYPRNLVRRRLVMVVLVLTMLAALLPTAAFAAPDNSLAAAYPATRYQPRQQYDRYNRNYHEDRDDRFDRDDRYDRDDRHNDYGNRHFRCDATYRVHRGDTLTRIARHFHVSVQALARANNIRNPNRIFAGQVLCIP